MILTSKPCSSAGVGAHASWNTASSFSPYPPVQNLFQFSSASHRAVCALCMESFGLFPVVVALR
jgi:hypothetical protein